MLSGFLIRHLAGAVGFSLSKLCLKLLDCNGMLLIRLPLDLLVGLNHLLLLFAEVFFELFSDLLPKLLISSCLSAWCYCQCHFLVRGASLLKLSCDLLLLLPGFLGLFTAGLLLLFGFF